MTIIGITGITTIHHTGMDMAAGRITIGIQEVITALVAFIMGPTAVLDEALSIIPGQALTHEAGLPMDLVGVPLLERLITPGRIPMQPARE
jgi:hypothetical protein